MSKGLELRDGPAPVDYAREIFLSKLFLLELRPEDLIGVPRFMGTGYHPEIFGSPDIPRDNVFEHTLRITRYAGNLFELHPEVFDYIAGDQSLSRAALSLLFQTTTPHDAPEIITRDVVGSEKGVVGEGGFNEELLVAESMLSREYCDWDFRLWQDMAAVDQALKTGALPNGPKDAGINTLVVLLDKADGHLVYNHLVTEFLRGRGSGGLPLLPPEKSLTFAFRQIGVFIDHLYGVEDVDNRLLIVTDDLLAWGFCVPVLDSCLRIIGDLWSDVDSGLIPDPVKPYLENIARTEKLSDYRDIFGDHWRI